MQSLSHISTCYLLVGVEGDVPLLVLEHLLHLPALVLVPFRPRPPLQLGGRGAVAAAGEARPQALDVLGREEGVDADGARLVAHEEAEGLEVAVGERRGNQPDREAVSGPGEKKS